MLVPGYTQFCENGSATLIVRGEKDAIAPPEVVQTGRQHRAKLASCRNTRRSAQRQFRSRATTNRNYQ
jgi:hypothetical protein